MFDSVKLWMPQERTGSTNILAQTPVYLQNITEHSSAGQIHYSGFLNNLNIYVTDRGVSVKGSLAKYHLGDNIKTLTRSDTEQAVHHLSDELHLSMQNADISRVDFAHNFLMKYKPEIYFKYMGESQYFDRYTKANSLYYESGSRTKLFYDKLLEAKSKAINIPERLNGNNILRYEIRYKRRLGKQLQEPEITAGTLFREPFYIKMTERYVSEYQSIHKNADIKLNTDKMDSPKDFWRQIALMKIDEIGINKMMQMIDEWRAKDVFDNKAYYSRLKKEIRDYSKQYEAEDATPLIEELDSKVSRVKMHYR